MMYFRSSGLVRSLGIRTVDNGEANNYEDSETRFYLGGPHEFAVEMRNATEDDLGQSKRRDLYLVCRTTGKWEPGSQEVRDAFETLSEGRTPNRTESIEEVQREFEQSRREAETSGYSFPWDVLPSSLQKFISQVDTELHQAVKSSGDALRWRYGILGPLSPYSFRRSEWSFDAEQWYTVPSGLQLHVELAPTSTVHLTDKVRGDVQDLLSEGSVEPLGHVLFREAWAQRESSSPRSALVIGVAALEAGFKRFVAELVPDAEWLLENAPTPPLVTMLKNYLPTLPAKHTFEGEVLPPPSSLRRTLDEAVRERNRVIHTGSATFSREALDKWLQAIRDILWLLDYYRGFGWALSHVHKETKDAMGL